MRRPCNGACLLLTMLMIFSGAHADGPQDNVPDQVRPVPPPGIEVPETDRLELEQQLSQLAKQLTELRKSKDRLVVELLPDVEIYYRAIDGALKHHEFFNPQEVRGAKKLLETGIARAEQLAAGQAPWTKQTGLVVRGFRSKLDQTVQPYGLIVPESYRGAPVRLDIWLHGRGEKVSEVGFLHQRSTQIGQVAPRDAIVLHPYGRYCNAFKFAGEVDVLEAMAAVQRQYAIDEDRMAIRGFSMGGAGCWQFAVHYPDLWFAATPGAGFSETPAFLASFQQETLTPTAWERTLWRLYDCPGYAVNLFNCPTIAYSGELDIQKQAADVMDQSLQQVGIPLVHLIGPQTKHSIHPDSAAEIERRLQNLAARGRQRVPQRIRFTTFTLKYNRSHWLTLNGLKKHWEPARVEAEITGPDTIQVTAENVTGLTLAFPAGWCPFEVGQTIRVAINGTTHQAAPVLSDRSWSFHWWENSVQPSGAHPESGLHKRAGLQGPIDDAFMDTFLIVRPSGRARHAAVDKWSLAELDRLVREWRRHFRGDAQVKLDAEVTDEDILSAHLILFGDPQSNSVLARLANQLPVAWTSDALTLGSEKYEATHHAPVLIYPNPLNPQRYVVLNSGFTFREYDYLNNARQVPRLPDWAIVDLRSPPNSKYPGKVVQAGFFGERWELTNGSPSSVTK